MEKPFKNPMQLQLDGTELALPRARPLRLLVLGHFSGRENTSMAERIAVNTDNFNDVFSHVKPSVSIHLPQLENQQDSNIMLEKFRHFQPKHLVKCLPVLSNLCNLTENIQAHLQHRLSASKLRTHLTQDCAKVSYHRLIQDCLHALDDNGATHAQSNNQKATHSAAPSAPNVTHSTSVDALFDLVDTKPGTSEQTKNDPLPYDAMVNNICDGKHNTNRSLIRCLNECQALLHANINSLLHTPAWRNLEASWRGLKLLLDGTDFRESIMIEILDVRKDNLAEVLTSTTLQSAFQDIEKPCSVMIVDFLFQHNDVDLALLQELAQCAESLQTPVVCGLEQNFFGVADIGRMDQPGRLLEQPGYAKWQALRDKECSRWLAVGANRFLLREIYDPENTGDAFKEAIEFLWGNPAWIIACLITQSQAHHGWPTELTGQQHSIDRLALTPHFLTGDIAASYPLENKLSLPAAEDLCHAGIIALLAQSGRDSVFVILAQCVHRAAHFSDQHTTQRHRFLSSLNYQILLSQFIAMSTYFKSFLPRELDAATMRERWQKYLQAYFSQSGPGYSVQVQWLQNSADSQQCLLQLHIQTGANVLGGVPLEIHLPI